MKVGVLGVMGAVGRLLLSLLLVSWEGRLFQVKTSHCFCCCCCCCWLLILCVCVLLFVRSLERHWHRTARLSLFQDRVKLPCYDRTFKVLSSSLGSLDSLKKVNTLSLSLSFTLSRSLLICARARAYVRVCARCSRGPWRGSSCVCVCVWWGGDTSQSNCALYVKTY